MTQATEAPARTRAQVTERTLRRDPWWRAQAGTAPPGTWVACATAMGNVNPNDNGSHEYPRLAHVGDRTGLEMIRALQQKVVAMQQADAAELGDPGAMIKVYAETPSPAWSPATAGCPAPSATSGTPAASRTSRRQPWCWRPAGSAGPSRSPPIPGSTRGTARPGAAGGRDPAEHGVRAVPPHPHGLAAVG